MIGRISGVLLEKKTPELLVDVNGVGYEVLVSLTTYFELPDEGTPATLHTHLVVREDVQQLYGFGTLGERELFRNLIKVNGVGPKMALTILSGMNASDLVRCVQCDDVSALVRLPGVGKKTAERLLIELRDKVANLSHAQPSSESTHLSRVQPDAMEEAESALIALGYKPQEAARMITAVHQEDEKLETSELVRKALKSVVKK